MNLNIIIIILYIYGINNKINNGVYILTTNNFYLSYDVKTVFVSDKFRYPHVFFRIIKLSNNQINNDYYIEGILSKYYLSFLDNNELVFKRNKKDIKKWNFIKIKKNIYIVKNNDNSYVIMDKLKVFCEKIPPQKATQFKIIKIFSEIKKKHSTENDELLRKEPIDVLIKYIDLRDPKLNRNNIHQIEKDYDNEELRYSIRSILYNIPWIRKIFILMPNEKVRYFKDYKLIKEKIVYVNDKDFLGYDSSNFNAFLFRYWKMKKFGISDNIIIMDDDYFIRSKLKKSDFFYVKNGRVLPAIITSHFVQINNISVQEKHEFYKIKAKTTKDEQNDDIFQYVKYLTYSFILNIFNIPNNESIFIPLFTHNAIPMNLQNIKEIYILAKLSKYKYTTLDCPYRHYEYLQFQLLFQAYTFIKYRRKVNNIPSKFIQINDSISDNYDSSLFCLNKGAGHYSYINFYNAKIVMEYLFPRPSPYEIIDNSLINISYNITRFFDTNIKSYEKKLSVMIFKSEYYFSLFNIIILFFLLFIKLYYSNYFMH